MISNEWVLIKAGQAVTTAILAFNKENWWHAQKMGMSDEKVAEAEEAE